MTWYNQHHLKPKSRQNTASLSKITEFTHRLFPSPWVKIPVPLEGTHFLSFVSMTFKNNWVLNSDGLSKIPVVNHHYNWLFWVVKVAPKIAETFLHVSVTGPQTDPCENHFASVLILSSLISFHLNYLYWLCNPPPVMPVEVLIPLVFGPTFSCSPLHDITKEEHSHNFKLGS